MRDRFGWGSWLRTEQVTISSISCAPFWTVLFFPEVTTFLNGNSKGLVALGWGGGGVVLLDVLGKNSDGIYWKVVLNCSKDRQPSCAGGCVLRVLGSCAVMGSVIVDPDTNDRS